jgi:hypothetical protein
MRSGGTTRSKPREIDMTTTTQEPRPSAPSQAIVKEQVATKSAPPGPASTPKAGGTPAASWRIKFRPWFVVVTLLILAAGGAFAWANATGTDLGQTLTAA